MPRCSAGVKSTAGSTTLPLFSVFSSPTVELQAVEFGVFNTTVTAFDVKLCRITSGPGTVGAGLTEACLSNPLYVPAAQAFTTHSAGAPTLVDLGYRASIGAAIGAGVVFTFGGSGVEVAAAAGTVNGLCVVVENGTGQAAQCYAIWDE